MASPITGVSIVYSTIWLNQTSKRHVSGLYEENPPVTGEFPSQRASNAENVSIWWRHNKTYEIEDTHIPICTKSFIYCHITETKMPCCYCTDPGAGSTFRQHNAISVSAICLRWTERKSNNSFSMFKIVSTSLFRFIQCRITRKRNKTDKSFWR